MNVEIGTEAPIFLSWEYLFQIYRHFVFAVHAVKAFDKRTALNIEKEAWTNLLLFSGWISQRAATLLIT
jgi:hypothetical protein